MQSCVFFFLYKKEAEGGLSTHREGTLEIKQEEISRCWPFASGQALGPGPNCWFLENKFVFTLSTHCEL